MLELKRRLALTRLGQVDQVQLLALFGPRDVRGQEGVHEGLEVGPPPLRQRVAHRPLVVDGLAAELVADWGEALVQSRLEPPDLVVFGPEVVARSVIDGSQPSPTSSLSTERLRGTCAWPERKVEGRFVCARLDLDSQFEESVGNLQHQDVRVVVLVADQHPLTGPSHAMLLVVLFQSLKPGQYRGVFFRLVFFGAKGVVAQRVEANCLRLVGAEGLGDDGACGGMLVVCAAYLKEDALTGRRFGGRWWLLSTLWIENGIEMMGRKRVKLRVLGQLMIQSS